MTRSTPRRAATFGATFGALGLLAALAGWPHLVGGAQDQHGAAAAQPAATPATTPATTPAAPPAAAHAGEPAAGAPAGHGAEAGAEAGAGAGHDAAHDAAARAAAVETGPFARAPRDVPLVITEAARLVSQGADVVDGLAAREPRRFSQDGGHWVDGTGEFTWDDDEEIYWQTVPADVLTRGRQDFVQFCSSCHGLQGDGNGRSGRALRPPPRSFLQSTFKFTKVESKYLPSDDAIVALVKHGLDGTPMLKWDVSEERLRDIVQYIKSLSPEGTGWRDATNEVAGIVETRPDPWAGKEKEAIAAGEASYHNRQCYSCHPGYATPQRINAFRGVDATTTYPDDLTYSKLKRDSSFDVQGYHVAIPAPDFTWDAIRYGANVTEVYQTIKAGIGGAGMPTWKGSVPDEEIWAVAHYVRHLVDTWKDKPGRAAFMAGLRKGS